LRFLWGRYDLFAQLVACVEAPGREVLDGTASGEVTIPRSDKTIS
jgi:hypothetical protein